MEATIAPGTISVGGHDKPTVTRALAKKVLAGKAKLPGRPSDDASYEQDQAV